MRITRRKFQQMTAASMCGGLASLATQPSGHGTAWADQAKPSDTGPLETFVPTRAITRGPLNHWFGYYDKQEFDPTGRFVLSNEIDFEGRSPTGDDSIGVGYVDTHNDDAWTSLGRSNAWGWQQGCMLQWVGQNGDRILWNDRQEDEFVCRLYNKTTGEIKTLPRPIYTISADGRFGLSVDFRRIDNLRPGYGYDGLADPNVADRAPQDSGVWRVDLETGESKLILSLADVAAIPWPDGDRHADAWHYFNHLLINPSGTRFTVLHRYRPGFDPKTLQYQGGFVTRMFTADVDGGNRYVLDPSGYTSHFIWKDDQQVTMWTKPEGRSNGFYTLTDQTDQIVAVGADKMPGNGHNTYLPAPYSDWILNDTYPDRKTSRQTVYLYHVPSGRRVDLGHFPAPKAYRGEWRCDTHPRSSSDGTQVAIDSPHNGGRQVYVMDIKEVLQG
ncbi:hypothetical protein K227x_24790 [Rubripirellula lacrimiformis]|uniref:Uncharacterized protein n=1 Tax=Rubripirellula lacrimiformis TaxID=1930273 RepID=A0A517NAD1_9BACT|nr:hypothetical protein [Rubripirellula lacrimiformis]QDT04091.1 hypothetical protein K227x_24790 [Rubripirellula lacrimiformis]